VCVCVSMRVCQVSMHLLTTCVCVRVCNLSVSLSLSVYDQKSYDCNYYSKDSYSIQIADPSDKT